jgi:hypothetical protein
MSSGLVLFDVPQRSRINRPAGPTLAVISNSGKTYNFVPGFNSITREAGWRPEEIPGFDPVPAVMMVHDILEHFPGDEYEPHNEYQAQGAMFWLRHEGGYFAGKLTSQVVIPPAFGMLFAHIIEKDLETRPCPLTKFAHNAISKDESIRGPFSTENEMQTTIFNARHFINGGEVTGKTFAFPANTTVGDTLFNDRHKARIHESLNHGIGWMRIGFRRAALRYKGLDKTRLVTMYQRAQAEIEKYTKAASTNSVLSVKLTPEKYRADITMVSEIEV